MGEKNMVAETRAVAASSASAASEAKLVEVQERLGEERRTHSSALEALRAEVDASASAAALARAELTEANERLDREQREATALREHVVEVNTRLEFVESELREACSPNADLKVNAQAIEK